MNKNVQKWANTQQHRLKLLLLRAKAAISSYTMLNFPYIRAIYWQCALTCENASINAQSRHTLGNITTQMRRNTWTLGKNGTQKGHKLRHGSQIGFTWTIKEAFFLTARKRCTWNRDDFWRFLRMDPLGRISFRRELRPRRTQCKAQHAGTSGT